MKLTPIAFLGTALLVAPAYTAGKYSAGNDNQAAADNKTTMSSSIFQAKLKADKNASRNRKEALNEASLRQNLEKTIDVSIVAGDSDGH
jgi:hypothetical protein